MTAVGRIMRAIPPDFCKGLGFSSSGMFHQRQHRSSVSECDEWEDNGLCGLTSWCVWSEWEHGRRDAAG